jgi:signal transduction histidine kinase
MRQRIEALAGTLQVESEPGIGTGISACLPAVSGQARA